MSELVLAFYISRGSPQQKPAPALCSIKLASQSSRAKETEKGLNLAVLASFARGKVDKLRR